jgi:hypothetical protein
VSIRAQCSGSAAPSWCSPIAEAGLQGVPEQTRQRSEASRAHAEARRPGDPPWAPQNKWVPSEPIETIPSYAQWVPFPTSRTCYRRTLARRSYLYSERFRVCSKDSPTARRQADRERKEKPRVSGAKFGGTSNVRTAHAATIDKRRVAMRLCSRCDGDHKNALFARRRADLGVEILASIWLPFAQLS